jgi:hypothetical protein
MPQPQCPFCQRSFQSIDLVTKHLLFDQCTGINKSSAANPPEGSENTNDTAILKMQFPQLAKKFGHKS